MSRKHANISVFVPHIGCPNMCSFCNQRHITGSYRAPHADDVISSVRTAVLSKNYSAENTEIAFFGGSFTAINRNYMIELLKTADIFVKNGTVKGIRVSTRPDAIDREILSILREYGVTSIELGAQSLDNHVLRMNNRGHTAEDVAVSSKLIKEDGFELGLQMMTGLYCDSEKSVMETAQKIIALSPDTVRIYPTICLKDTYLAALYADNKYEPQTLEEAVTIAARLLDMFDNAGIDIIRLGLHSIEADSYLAGPWHPAFSELCRSRQFFLRVKEKLTEKGSYTISVNQSSVSKMTGQHRSNLETLKKLGFDCKVRTDNSVGEHEFSICKDV